MAFQPIADPSLPLMSIVIPTYGPKGVQLTKKCLESLWSSGCRHPKDDSEDGIESNCIVPELVVIDDGSDQETLTELELVCEANGVHHVLHAQENTAHFAALVNEGIRHTSGMVVVICNNDIEFLPGCLQTMLAGVLQGNHGIVVPKLLYPDLRVQFGGMVYIQNLDRPSEHGFFDHAYRWANRHHIEVCFPVNGLLTGACMAIGRGVIDAIGLLDERFPLSAEDVDYVVRARMAGIRTMFWPYAEAIHHEGGTRGNTVEGKQEHPEWTERERQSLDFLFNKWRLVEWEKYS